MLAQLPCRDLTFHEQNTLIYGSYITRAKMIFDKKFLCHFMMRNENTLSLIENMRRTASAALATARIGKHRGRKREPRFTRNIAQMKKALRYSRSATLNARPTKPMKISTLSKRLNRINLRDALMKSNELGEVVGSELPTATQIAIAEIEKPADAGPPVEIKEPAVQHDTVATSSEKKDEGADMASGTDTDKKEVGPGNDTGKGLPVVVTKPRRGRPAGSMCARANRLTKKAATKLFIDPEQQAVREEIALRDAAVTSSISARNDAIASGATHTIVITGADFTRTQELHDERARKTALRIYSGIAGKTPATIKDILHPKSADGAPSIPFMSRETFMSFMRTPKPLEQECVLGRACVARELTKNLVSIDGSSGVTLRAFTHLPIDMKSRAALVTCVNSMLTTMIGPTKAPMSVKDVSRPCILCVVHATNTAFHQAAISSDIPFPLHVPFQVSIGPDEFSGDDVINVYGTDANILTVNFPEFNNLKMAGRQTAGGGALIDIVQHEEDFREGAKAIAQRD